MTSHNPETLTRLGYRRVSNKYGIVARIDREDFVQVLARSLRRAPADFYVPGGTDRVAGNWCDYYRRVHSKDRIELPREVARRVPPSGHDSTGFVKLPKPVVESTPGTGSDWVEGMFDDKSRTGPDKTNLNMGSPFSWRIDKFYTGGTVSGRGSMGGPEVQTLKPYQHSALEALARRDQMSRVVFVSPRKHSKLVSLDLSQMEKRIMGHLSHSVGVPGKRIKPARTVSETGAEAERLVKKFRDQLEGAMADLVAGLVITSLQRDIDEEGCGAVMAALKSWKG